MPTGSPRRFLLLLGVIAAAAVVVRIVAITVWAQDLELAGDQMIYHDTANGLAKFMGYTIWHPVGEYITTANHPPLHATILGAASALGAQGETAHRLVGALLGGATSAVAGLAAWRITALVRPAVAPVAGLAAAGLVAIAPTLWINDSMVLSESSYALAVAGVLLVAAEVVARPSLFRMTVLGGVVALAALTRAEAAVMGVLVLVGLAIWVVPAGHRLRYLTAAVLVGAVVAAPWLVRNLTAFEQPQLLSSGTGFVLEIANCDQTYYGDRLGYWAVECDRTPWEMGDESATEAVKRETGIQYMRENAGRLPVVMAARIGRMWDLYEPEENIWLNSFYERRGAASSRAALYGWWAMSLAGLAGAWSLRRRPVLLLPFAAAAVAVTAAAVVSFGITRYRTGMEVAMAILAATAIAAACAGLRHLGARSEEVTS